VVQRGDTLSELALQWGTTVEDLAAANGIADPDLIYIGQTLYH
jgi:LysM repeat protein